MNKIYCLRGTKYTRNKNPNLSGITNNKALISACFYKWKIDLLKTEKQKDF